MATYPTDPAPQYPLVVTPRYRTLIAPLDGGSEQRRSKFAYPKYDVLVTYSLLEAVDISTLWDFFVARRGAYGAFYIIDYVLKAYTDLYVGLGDGSTTIYDLPGAKTSARTVYINGVDPVGESFLSGGGEGGADRVQFASAPADGDVLTVDFTGYLRCHVRFELDTMDRELFSANFLRMGGVQLIGVAPV